MPTLVDRPTEEVLVDLRNYAQENPWFADRLKKKGTELTQEWLTRRAEQSAFKGHRLLRKLVPSVTNHWRTVHERTILNALCVVTGVSDKQIKS